MRMFIFSSKLSKKNESLFYNLSSVVLTNHVSLERGSCLTYLRL